MLVYVLSVYQSCAPRKSCVRVAEARVLAHGSRNKDNAEFSPVSRRCALNARSQVLPPVNGDCPANGLYL